MFVFFGTPVSCSTGVLSCTRIRRSNSASAKLLLVIKKPVNYLSNKLLLAEIARCKASHCEFLEPRYASYDLIIHSLDKLTPEQRQPGTIIRLMTFEHIPLSTTHVKGKRLHKEYVFTPFLPFKHYEVQDDLTLREVGRSHWRGGFQNGHFDAERGRLTPQMAKMLFLLVERYARRPNWIGYSYNDDMKSAALVQVCSAVLKFDESKSSNPFSFLTTTLTNAFIRVWHDENRQQTIRDDVLWAEGQTPSVTRQTEMELGKYEAGKVKRSPTKRAA